jgi:hypothetical protein
MRPQVTRAEIKVTLTMATVFLGLLVALALLALPSAGAQPPREGPGGQAGATVTSTVPTMISYQGQLLDSNGNPVNGTHSMTFKLYDAPTGGNLLWSETQSVQVTNGLFNVLLGEYAPLWFTSIGETSRDVYLGVTVGSGSGMTPRQQIVSVPYAFVADTAKNGGGWTEDTGVVRLTTATDNVGIGTSNPQEKLHVVGNVRIEGASPVWTTLVSNLGTDAGMNLTTDGTGVNTWKIMREGASTDFLIKETFPYPPLSVDAFTIKHLSGNVGIGTRNPGDYKLNVKGEKAGIYSVATEAANTPRPFAVVADLDILGGYAAHGGGFEATVNTSKIPATSIPYVFGGYFRMEDDGNTGLSQSLRGVTIALLNTQQDDYGLEMKVDDPSYAIYSSGTGTAYFAGKVGIGTDDPHTKLQVAGPVATAIRSVATNYNITEGDSIVVVTSGSGDITLPSPVGIDGRQYTIKNMSNSDVTVRTSVGVIESMPTYLLKGLLLGGVGKSITVVSDGARWLIISEIK